MFHNELEDKGLFVAALYDYQTCTNLYNFIKTHKIPNPVNPNSFHTTIVHSVIDCSFEENHNADVLIPPENVRVGIIENAYGKVLVLKIDSKYLTSRYQESLRCGASANFDAFNPHITLSINIGQWDHTQLPEIDFPLRIIGEYSKPLEIESLNYQTEIRYEK